MKIHIEGMGVLGGFLALELTYRGVDFTWSDADATRTAWRASTGAVYPSGNQRDMEGYIAFYNNAEKLGYDRFMERADYWYSGKNPPHGFKINTKPFQQMGLSLCPAPSYHFNAQQFVPYVRKLFGDKRSKSAVDGETKIISHGFSAAKRFVWGWTTLVDIEHDLYCSNRPSVYVRPNLYQMAYLYPVPNTRWWYLGSSLIPQSVPRDLIVDTKRERCIKLLEKYFAFSIKEVGETIQGWRPSLGKAAEDSKAPLAYYNADGSIQIRPLWHSGIRWSQLAVGEALRLAENV